FIEFMPFDGNRWNSDVVFTCQDILDKLQDNYTFFPKHMGIHDTAKRYVIPGYQGSFAMISTMTQPFCAGCNRMRLTADGKMKNCLFSTYETDLLTALRKGED